MREPGARQAFSEIVTGCDSVTRFWRSVEHHVGGHQLGERRRFDALVGILRARTCWLSMSTRRYDLEVSGPSATVPFNGAWAKARVLPKQTNNAARILIMLERNELYITSMRLRGAAPSGTMRAFRVPRSQPRDDSFQNLPPSRFGAPVVIAAAGFRRRRAADAIRVIDPWLGHGARPEGGRRFYGDRQPA
jgi:hypothetical protein